MPLLIVKSLSGVNFRAGNKTIALNGNGVVNEVSSDDLKLLKENEAFKDAQDKGYIVDSTSHNPKDEVKSDIMSEVEKKQDDDIAKAGNKTKRV